MHENQPDSLSVGASVRLCRRFGFRERTARLVGALGVLGSTLVISACGDDEHRDGPAEEAGEAADDAADDARDAAEDAADAAEDAADDARDAAEDAGDAVEDATDR